MQTSTAATSAVGLGRKEEEEEEEKKMEEASLGSGPHGEKSERVGWRFRGAVRRANHWAVVKACAAGETL